jgi:hypothetical protein
LRLDASQALHDLTSLELVVYEGRPPTGKKDDKEPAFKIKVASCWDGFTVVRLIVAVSLYYGIYNL